MSTDFELRDSPERGKGVFATASFDVGDTVMVGVIEKVLDDNSVHASQIAKEKFVLHAGLISKVNHSCDPNCGIRVNETGAHDFVAIKEIALGDELTFDYAMRNYTVDHFPEICKCNSRNCRGKITGWKDLSSERKKSVRRICSSLLA